MIISRTPYRVSFFGGGTDFPAWYKENGGEVLSTTINRYSYITGRYLPPFFEHKHRIAYAIVESVKEIDEIQHPAVREALRYMQIKDGVEIHHDGDLPKQTGLGTSSSFAVGILNVLHALKGEMATKQQLAEEAIHIERDLCGDNVGSQDQIAAAFGGLNHIEFLKNGTFLVHPIIISQHRIKQLEKRLMLFFTGFARSSSEIIKEQINNIEKKEQELKTIQGMVKEGINILTNEKMDINDFGLLLNDGWQVKRNLSSKVSNANIDALYERALRAGALGGKITGAGGGGFMLLFVDPEKKASVRAALKDCLSVPFGLEFNGTQIIFYQPHVSHH